MYLFLIKNVFIVLYALFKNKMYAFGILFIDCRFDTSTEKNILFRICFTELEVN